MSTPEKPSKTPRKALQKDTRSPSNRSSAIATDDRRRSQRVMMRVGVILRFTLGGKEMSLQAHTVAVNIHGAMICARQNISAGTQLEVEHKITQERIAAQVTLLGQGSPDGFLIPVEFTAASVNFWRISFPPSDWKPTD